MMMPSALVRVFTNHRDQTNSVRETRTGAQHAKEINGFVLQVENICACACTELEEEYTTLKNTKA